MSSVDVLNVFLITIIKNIKELGNACIITKIDDFVIHCFGFDDDIIEECEFWPNYILRMLKIKKYQVFSKITNYAAIIIRHQFHENVINNELFIENIQKTFFIVFQNMNDGNCTKQQFIENIKAIPFYTNKKVIRKYINKFIISVAAIFCPINNAKIIEEILS
jgi:hypothetical protein